MNEENPPFELAENHPLFAIYLDAIHQATSGKGERHGGAATPFLEQRWHNISKSTGFRSLVYQACKKMEEACGKEDTEAWEREMLGGIVYAGMALIHSRLHGYTKETKVENDSKN